MVSPRPRTDFGQHANHEIGGRSRTCRPEGVGGALQVQIDEQFDVMERIRTLEDGHQFAPAVLGKGRQEFSKRGSISTVGQGQRVNQREGHLALRHVHATRLAHVRRAAKVQQVVHQLEGNAKFFAEGSERAGLIFGAAGQQGSGLTTGREGSSGFPTNDVQVILGGGRQIVDVVQLLEFRDGDVRTAIRHQSNHAFWIAATESEPLNEEPISRNQGLFWTRFEMEGSTTTSLVGVVVHVVVHEGRGVDEFERQRKGHHVITIRSASGIVGEHEQYWAKALPTAHQHVPRHRDDLPAARRFCVVEEGFEATVNLVFEVRKTLDLD